MILKIKELLKSNKRWAYVFLSLIIMVLLGTVYSYSVFRVGLESYYKIGAAKSGIPYMMGLFSYAVFMLISGKHLDKYKPRNILIFGSLLVSLGWVLSSYTNSIFLLTVTYGIISGGGVGIAYGVPMSVIARWFPDKKGFALGLILVGFGLSPLITAPIARFLVEGYGIKEAFLILGLTFGILLPLLSLPFRNPREEEVIVYKNKIIDNKVYMDVSLKEMLKTNSFKGLYINFIIGTMIGLTMIGVTTSVGLDYFNLSLSSVTKLMALFAIFNGLGRPTFGYITDRYSTKNAMLLSYGLIILSSLSIILLKNNIVVYAITFSIFWFNLGGWLAIAPTSTLNLYGIKNYSQNYGLIFTGYGIGAIAGVSTSGFLLDYHGNYHFLFYYIISLCFIGIITSSKYLNTKSQINLAVKYESLG